MNNIISLQCLVLWGDPGLWLLGRCHLTQTINPVHTEHTCHDTSKPRWHRPFSGCCIQYCVFYMIPTGASPKSGRKWDIGRIERIQSMQPCSDNPVRASQQNQLVLHFLHAHDGVWRWNITVPDTHINRQVPGGIKRLDRQALEFKHAPVELVRHILDLRGISHRQTSQKAGYTLLIM